MATLGKLTAIYDPSARERTRLEKEVVAAAKVLHRDFRWHGEFVDDDAAQAYDAFKRSTQSLVEFEWKQQK